VSLLACRYRASTHRIINNIQNVFKFKGNVVLSGGLSRSILA
jgi:hypothetical protein